MIITKESDVFQKLLKDVEFIKQALTFSGKYYIGCDPIEEKSPKFKTGDWVYRTVGKDDKEHAYGRVFKITVMGSKHGDIGAIRDDDGFTHFHGSLRHATVDEIKEVLVRDAIKRGFIGYCKFEWNDVRTYRGVSTLLTTSGYNYIKDLDLLLVSVAESSSKRSIYANGKWANLIHEDPPKAIVLTESTLYNLFKDFASEFYPPDYLDDRDFDIYKFLKAKGYFKK